MIILFLLAVLIDFILISFLIENDEPSPFWALLLIILGFVGYYFLVDKINFTNLIDYIKGNFEVVLGYTVAYIGIGILWSFWRWYMFLLNIKNLRENASPAEIKNGRLKSNYASLAIPEASNHKGEIIQWISYWPFSLFGTICKKWIANLFSTIYDHLSSTFDKISLSVFADEKLKKEIEPILTEKRIGKTKVTKEKEEKI